MITPSGFMLSNVKYRYAFYGRCTTPISLLLVLLSASTTLASVCPREAGGWGGALPLPHHEPPHHHHGHSCRVFLASSDQLCPCHEEMTIIAATAFRCRCVLSPLAAFVLHSSPVPPPPPPRSFSFFSSLSLIYTPTHTPTHTTTTTAKYF